uniref:MBL fold metallo-hydrolase n=1 Tax=Thaumasiovibrio occultus TaxID=1891184 RepID=UPI000B363D0F|nr:MBL fold metallo-hydrolase [Thaumasiovibrio occultus]
MPNGISVKMLEVGHCTHPGFMVNPKLGIKPRAFPASVAVIRHPEHGVLLFDTGYHHSFFDATAQFPQKCYAIATPCHLHHDEHIVGQLASLAIDKETVSHVVLSHFHADHIAAVREFTHAQLHCHPAGLAQLRRKPVFQAIRRGYLSELLPAEQQQQCVFHQDGFTQRLSEILALDIDIDLWAKDLFGDQLLYLVDLPGHAAGQLGLLIRLEQQWLFLLADACWLVDNLRDGVNQHWLANIICDDRKAYKATLNVLRQCYHAASNVLFVPAHCSETLAPLKQQDWLR